MIAALLSTHDFRLFSAALAAGLLLVQTSLFCLPPRPAETGWISLTRTALAGMILGGAIWGTGTVFSLTAGKLTGQAISYAIGQSAPMVAALWGVLAWKEFAGSGTRAKMYLVLMFVFYGLAILLVARANG